ncbi:aspartic peptidase domain-containing protein [Butyriboletus roseoflavus]|nr:aspartic peptidase domain-containing protein [Butyriboletus roseoflavus]
MRLSSFLPLGFLALAARVDATHLRLSGRLGSTSHHLERRTSMTGTVSQLSDSQNLVYLTNVTLNGAMFSIMIDTGSSDLWVSSPVPAALPQKYQTSVSYASGSASGNVMSATLKFAGFSITSQFFIEAPQGNAAAGANGLIGLGPSSGSSVRALGGSAAANPPLDRIFTSNASVSPLIAILLQRSDDSDEPYPGDLAVGEVLADYQDIFNQPRHPVTLAPLASGQHWQTLLDVNGIIGPNGKPIQIKTQVTGAQTQNATVVFDTGFTLPQVPPYVAQALYGGIPGAVLTNLSSLGEIWVLPCDQEVNATFLFGGVEFPIHPLDLNFDGFGLQANGKGYCVGAFQPYSFNIVEQNEILFDMILGMAFLRNAYMLINFGNLVNATTPSTDTAYIQLLPLTNATQAAHDFAEIRNGTGSATGDELGKIFGSGGSGSSSESSLAPWVIGLVAGIGLVLILLIAGITCCCRRRRIKNASAPDTAWVGNPPSYRPIYEPSPQAAYDIHMAPSAPPGYTPMYMPEYKTAWDAHY